MRLAATSCEEVPKVFILCKGLSAVCPSRYVKKQSMRTCSETQQETAAIELQTPTMVSDGPSFYLGSLENILELWRHPYHDPKAAFD